MRCTGVARMGLLLVFGSFMAAALTGCGSGAAQTEIVQAAAAKVEPKTPPTDAAVGSSKGMAAMKKEGIADADIDLMMRKNPARLLGL